MSTQELSVALQKREILGKGLHKLRSQGAIPAVIHNPGKDSLHVSGNFMELAKIYQQAGKHHPVTVDIDGKKYLTIIKDVDFEIRKRQLRHVVFGIIKQNDPVETEVSIVYANDEDSPAQKAGYVLLKQLDAVRIEALPKDLPDNVAVSIENLKDVGDKITVADIIPQTGVTILTDPEHPIVTVAETAAQQSEESEETSEPSENTGLQAAKETPAE